MNLLSSSFVPNFIIIIIICLWLPLPLESSSFEAKSCSELWLKYGVRESGNYSLMVPDDDSRNCPGGRIQVECDMSDALAWQSDVDRDHIDRREQVFEIKTIVHHDSEESRLVQGYESPGSFERNIVYGLATSGANGSSSNQLQCIDWIIQQSYTCQQYIRWDCKGSVFNFWFQHYHNWWLDRRGRTQTYWGGAEPDSRSCGCFPYCHPTTKNSTCNCDANIKTDWLEDSGLLLAKDRLPVMQLRFGDTGESYEVGRYTLGPLICREHGHRNVTFGEFRAPVNLTSPGFPKRYPPAFRRYQWTVLVDRGQLIEMVFTEYDVIHYGAYVSVPGCRYAVSVDVFQEPKAEDPETDQADQIEHGGKQWTLVYRIRREKSSPPYYVTDGRATLFRLQLITCNQNHSMIQDHHQGFRVEFRPAKCSACAMRWPGGVVPINTTQVQCVVRPDQCLYVYSLGYPFAHYVYGQHIDHRLMVQQWNLKTTAEDHILQMEFNDFDVIVTPGQHYCDADLLVIQQPLPPQQNQTKQQQQRLNYCNINRFDIGKFTSGSSQIQLRLQTSLKKVGNSRGIHAMIRSIRKHRPPPQPDRNLTLTTTTTPGSGKSRWIKNAAVGRPTDQSSTRANREPSLAVDDNYEPREAAKCSSTNYEREPWWRVNLQKRHRIHGVRIYSYLGKHETIPIQPMFWERNMDVCTTSLCERQWPQGNYGLPMPSSGCPSSTEGGRWLHGMRFHAVQYDKPYDDKIRYWSENIMLKGGATSDGIEQHFCIHQDDHHHRSSLVTNDGDTSSTTKPVVNPNPNQSSCSANDTCQWQPGKYCILKYGDTCPEGFQVGSLTWFDKSSNASINHHHNGGQPNWNQNPSRKQQLFNSIHGVVPAGEYTTHNTTIYYCCREDGDPTKPINLPKTRPFYLFQYGRICQEVAGMSEMEHFFHYEEEVVLYGSIPDLVFTTGQKLKFQDPHPRIEVTLFDRGMTLHYCYYDIADKLKGFQVLVDTTPDTFGYGRVYDKDTGITRPVNKPFLSAVECAHYGTTEEEFDQITLNCSQPIEGQYVIIFMKERQDALQLCEVVVFGEESCGRPLGMATEEILDSAITASSFDSTKGLVYHPYNVRLNSFAAWCTNNLDQEKYIQIDLRLQNSNIVFDSKLPLGDESNWNNVNYVTIVGVAMQGMPNGFKSYFITHFQVLFSNDSRHWSFEEEPIGKQKVYKCVQCEAQHVDPNEVVMYNLLKPVVARFLRIKILAFRGGPCMRLELIGCRGDKKNFCSRTLTASTPGVISSPNYPFYYAQYKSCVWNIKPANPDGHIELDFIVLDLAPAEKSGGGKCLDQLIIYHSRAQSPITIEAGSGGLIHRLHSFKQQNFPKKIISNGPVMLNLKTCFRFSKTRYQGFLVRFRETDCPGCGIGDSRCSRLYNCSSLCGRIFSINYPLNYLNNYRCRWLIRAPAGHYFNISIEDFDVFSQPITAYATAASYNNSSSSTSGPTHRPVKNCLYDHLSFIDPSTGIVLGRYCNTNKPSKHILSNWNELLIEFSTDSSGNGRGFKLQYKAKRYDLLPEARRFLLPPNACPSGWLYFRGYCYKSFMEDESLQWYEAEEKCAQKAKGRDGHLVSITDYLEMNVVHYWIIEQWQMPPHQTIYIGLIDTNREGFYNWSDGNPMSYTDWYRSNFIGSSPLTGDDSTISLDNNPRNWSASSWSGGNQADYPNHYHHHQSSASFRSSIINGFNDLNNYFNQYSQPDGGAYEDCTVINFYSIHSTLNWHDVPCSLGKKVMPASKLTLSPAPFYTPSANSGHMISGSSSGNNSTTHMTSNSNSNSSSSSSSSGGSGNNNRRVQHHHHNDGLIRSYICKMDSNSSLHQYSPRRPLFQIRIGEEEKNQIKSKVDLNRYFVCNNFEVISNLFRCDGTANCRDGSDETEGCSISDKCLESQFQCANGHCIAIGKYCDFIDDCGDGSDEIFCFRPQCKKNSEFRCNNEQCIPNYKRCDLFHDCRDQSDEDNCNGKCNLNTTFQCYYGNCIPLYALCDRHRDCPGKFFEDEHETVCSAIVMNGGGHGSSATFGHGRKRRRINSSEASRASTYSNDCRQRDTRRETCQDLLEYQNIHQDGYYDLQPMPGNQLTLRVFCRFLNETHATTIINHDSEDRLYVRSSIDAPGSYVRIITYEGSLDLILTLIDSSEQCKQFVSYECSGSRFNFNTPKPNSWWVSRHGFREYSWGTDQPLACACYPNCISNLRCNCDAGLMFNWTRDYGYVRDRSKLPIRQVAFGEVYHIGQLGYVQIGPVECTGKSRPSNHHHQHHRDRLDCWQQAANIFRCNSGQIIDGKDVCLYEFDQLQYQIGCRDVSHLRNCSQHQCPPDYVKCPDSYCIPYRYLCNGKWDCVGGSDEIGCARYTCPGRYKCANESSCIWLHQLCDGFRHCPLGDDEWFCDLNCPESCICIGHFVDCRDSRNITREVLKSISRDTRKLDLSGNDLGPDLSAIDFSPYTYLGELILQNNQLEVIRSRKFIQLANLYKLDLRHNNIKIIEAAAFAGLQQVTTLMLDHNPLLEQIHSGAFVGLISLRRLNISNTQLNRLVKNLFLQMSSLQHLTLVNNQIDTIEKGAFNDLISLMSLDLRGNPIRTFSKDMFAMLKSLRNLATDSFKFCCMVSGNVPFSRCYPPQDEISDCEDLMSNTVQRLILWILGFGALIGNLWVVIWRLKTKNQTNRVSSVLILWLGFSDFLMGVYLIIIASVDEYYRGHYIENSDYWKNSILCKLCGFLSTLSSETSVMTLVFITIDRLISISFSFSAYRFTVKCAYRLLVLTWIIMFIISGLPLLPIDYFKGQFYSRSGVCLAFHITANKWPGWEYSVAIFLVFNLFAFLFILFCYLYMYKTIRGAVKKRRQMRAKQLRETNIGLQMALIVITNFLCWFPVIIMGLMALAGVPIPGAAYSWIAVLVLPLNSATNPLIYTLIHFVPNLLSSQQQQQRQQRSEHHHHPHLHQSNSNINGTNGGSVVQMRLTSIKQQQQPRQRQLSRDDGSIISVSMHRILMRTPPGYQTLNEFLRTKEPLTPNDLLEICHSLSETIKDHHQMGFAFGSLNCENIFVTIKPIKCTVPSLEDTTTTTTTATTATIHSNDQPASTDITNMQRLQAYIPPFNLYQVANFDQQDDPSTGGGGGPPQQSTTTIDNDDFAMDMEEFGKVIKRMLQVYHSRQMRDRSQNSFAHAQNFK